MKTNTTEKDFQKHIINYLESHGYTHRKTKNYNENVYLDIELLLNFIQNTQEKKWKRFQKVYGENSEAKFVTLVVNNIKKKGTIHILREGIRDVGTKFDFFYPKPNNNLNPNLFEKYEKNIFSVVDELEYENTNNSNRLDLVIFINGLPIITIELKDTFSQGVMKAVKQYKYDRDPKEDLFKNCIVHFAVSDEKIFMTTKLKGPDTKFLPFNRNINNPIIEGDFKTSYLYRSVLSKDNLSKLISNFIFLEDGVNIFPRYHQMDCVNKLINECSPGENYLIQHSAGSGKTKTIAWLAHSLLKKFTPEDNRVYDMVIVISDRKVIDNQLQEQVKSIQKRKGVVEVIDKNSKQLAEALKTGENIVVTTLQKFSYILEEVNDLPDRKYAVIIDEAHSSQTGSHAKEMHKILGNSDIDEDIYDDAEDTIDEIILRELEKSRNTDNISFFAFTATPKNKTLELFAKEDINGEFHPFHLYSMEQAIEEKFILDVLMNYTTYQTYFKLVKTIEEDPEINEEKTKKALKKFVEEHPHAISTKVDLMLTHFRNSTINKIDGKACAMVVTGSRKEAVRYKREFDQQIKDQNIENIKTLVAFTGIVKDKGIEYSEDSLNNINMSIPNALGNDDYRILIVANKYQTGFDEPLLHTMYVDKKLRGVKAVQTLSRLNRMYPKKQDTLVVDFANKTEDIVKAFEPYYQETYLTEKTDHHKLYELMDNIYDYDFFYMKDVNEFVKAYYKGVNQSVLHNLQSEIIDEINSVDDEVKTTFKKTMRKYQNIYSFLSQLMPFTDKNLEKLYIYNNFLYKKLPVANPVFIFNVNEDVDIDSYKIVETEKKETTLNPDGMLKPASGSGMQYHEEEVDKLSEIINDINKAHNTNFTSDDKVIINHLANNMLNNNNLSNRIDNNSRENVEAVFPDYFDEEINKIMESNFELFKKVNDDENLRNHLQTRILDFIYDEKGKNKI